MCGCRRRRTPLTRHIAELAVKGGLRAEVDPFWKTNITRNLVRAVARGRCEELSRRRAAGAVGDRGAAMRPIAEYLVPRQKLGVFAQLALQEMDRMGRRQPRETCARRWRARPTRPRTAWGR
jgi:hypothetical protein